jgi:hypothetical protein
MSEKVRLEIHKQVHDWKSKICDYGSPEFNEYRPMVLQTRRLINLG